MARFPSFGYISAIVGGMLVAFGAALQAVVVGGSLSDAAPTTAFAISAALRLSGAVGLIIGLTAIYVVASEPAGRFGVVAYTMVVTNMVLQSGWMWADLFLSPAVAANAPGLLDGDMSDSRLSAGFLLAWIMNASIAVLGFAILRARVYSRAVGGALIVMGAITLVPLPVDGPIYEVIIGLACSVAGAAARRSRVAPKVGTLAYAG